MEVISTRKIGCFDIPRSTGLYKWWCPEDLLKSFYEQIVSWDCMTGHRSGIEFNELLESIESRTIKGEKLYCFYVGKAKDLRNRIIGKHITGHSGESTLRKTILSIKFQPQDRSETECEKYVDTVLQRVYVEWIEVQASELNKREKEVINSNLRLFNLDDLDDEEYVNYGFDATKRRRIVRNIRYARKTN